MASQIGLSEEQRNYASSSFDKIRQRKLDEAWSNSMRLQGELLNARKKYYDLVVGGNNEEATFQAKLQDHMRDIRRQLNASIKILINGINQLRNDVIRNDNMIIDQDEDVKNLKEQILSIKNKIKTNRHDLVNKKVMNELLII